MKLEPSTSIPVDIARKQLLKKELVIFSMLALIISWPLILIVAHNLTPNFPTGNRKAVEELFGSLPLLYGTGPLISAVLVTLFYRGSAGVKALFKRVVEWRVSFRWYIFAVILPVVPQWIALVIWGLLSNNEIQFPALSSFLFSWIQIALVSAVYYVTEELGWRGFMLPRFLSIYTWVKASLLTGIIWSVWHYPLWATSGWATTGSLKETMLILGASTMFSIGLSILVTWMFINTKGSVLLAMLLHGSSQANLTKMYTAAGDASLTAADFILTQALFLGITVGLFLLLINLQGKLAMITEEPLDPL
ncbi:MAG: CPBP family intramembrane glutamic endopeptidase [Chryseolinea sp.]